jgi:hypothetical protein
MCNLTYLFVRAASHFLIFKVNAVAKLMRVIFAWCSRERVRSNKSSNNYKAIL